MCRPYFADCIANERTPQLARSLVVHLSTAFAIIIIIAVFPDIFLFYSIAFIACDYDALNTFTELIVKALMCHNESHIKVSNKRIFFFRLKVCTCFFLNRNFVINAAAQRHAYTGGNSDFMHGSIKYEHFYLNISFIWFLLYISRIEMTTFYFQWKEKLSAPTFVGGFCQKKVTKLNGKSALQKAFYHRNRQ